MNQFFNHSPTVKMVLTPIVKKISKTTPQRQTKPLPISDKKESYNLARKITDNGLCSVINSNLEEEKAGKDYLTRQLSKMNKDEESSDKGVKRISGYGTDHTKILVLTAPLTLNRALPQGGKFQLSVNHWRNFMDNRYTGFEVRTGYVTTLTVFPTVHKTTEEFRSIPEKKRNCKLPDEPEYEDGMYGYYSQRSCWFECTLRKVQSKFGCTPWDLPMLAADDDALQSIRYLELVQCHPFCSHISAVKAGWPFIRANLIENHSLGIQCSPLKRPAFVQPFFGR